MWHDEEVAKRWCRLFRGLMAKRAGKEFDEDKFEQIRKDRERIGICRRRLGDLSWFMRCLNESLARRANAEDECGGRFWEGRFHCQRLMDAGAILACMAYVDLNPVRAGMASGLEDSRFTSIYDRLVERRAKQRLSRLGKIDNPSRAQEREICREENRQGQARWLLQFGAKDSPLSGVDDEYYTALVEWTGRTIRTDKRGYIPVKLKRVLDRFNLDAEEWAKNVESYGTLFYRLVGPAEDLMMFAKNRGQRWIRGRSSSEQLYKTEKKAA
tara:strand:- start:12221 stop:13030 length:810 start_codon:yes stop_codon:yes gene_type:complete